MGYYSGTFFSRVLDMDTQLGVILPQDSRKHNGVELIKEGVEPSAKPKTLILLHGLGDNYLAWQARTSILRYAEEYDVAVLMPEVARSFYTDMASGRKYFTYITEELPKYAASVFNLSVSPEDLMIAGLSMGGYGALKCGLTYPERYLGVGVFSSAWDIKKILMDENALTNAFDHDEVRKDRDAIMGREQEVPEESDINKLFEKITEKKGHPKFYQVCGTEDFLYSQNQELKEKFVQSGLDFVYSEMPGCHEWAVWDRAIQYLLDYFIRGNKPADKYTLCC
ncbi:MAG: alpha/beta hydrolase family protein [Lachnospiraceae bacterium]|nr:alpha/beta hydrolase family protein [Lachnospiraceae bacterium]